MSNTPTVAPSGKNIDNKRGTSETRNSGVLLASGYGLPLTWRDAYVQKPNTEAQVFEFTDNHRVRSYPYFVAHLASDPSAFDTFIGLSGGGLGSDFIAFSELEELRQYAKDNVPTAETPNLELGR